jgi:hypothetical protein
MAKLLMISKRNDPDAKPRSVASVLGNGASVLSDTPQARISPLHYYWSV